MVAPSALGRGVIDRGSLELVAGVGRITEFVGLFAGRMAWLVCDFMDLD